MTSIAFPLRAADPGPGVADNITADADRSQDLPADGPGRSGPSADQGGPAPDSAVSRSATIPQPGGPVRVWPLLVLAAPAATAVWSGWVGIGQMTGFGQIRPLPGIWDSLHVDTAVTLPVGVEAYAAFALRVWLTCNPHVGDQTRRFARWSAIAALVLGMAGQVAYHLLAQTGITGAPWEITTLVACLPVLVLGMGSALAHMLRSDASSAHARVQSSVSHARIKDSIDRYRGDQSSDGPAAAMTYADPLSPISGRDTAQKGNSPDDRATQHPMSYSSHIIGARPPARTRLPDAYSAAERVIASGQHVSRRSLRSAGLHGSNADTQHACTFD